MTDVRSRIARRDFFRLWLAAGPASLTRMTFTSERPGGYWEDQGYPWFDGLQA